MLGHYGSAQKVLKNLPSASGTWCKLRGAPAHPPHPNGQGLRGSRGTQRSKHCLADQHSVCTTAQNFQTWSKGFLICLKSQWGIQQPWLTSNTGAEKSDSRGCVRSGGEKTLHRETRGLSSQPEPARRWVKTPEPGSEPQSPQLWSGSETPPMVEVPRGLKSTRFVDCSWQCN